LTTSTTNGRDKDTVRLAALGDHSRTLAQLTAAIATTAAFGKMFVPFFLIGSTAIFSILCLCAVILVAVTWRRLSDNAAHVYDFLVVTALLYSVVIASYLVNSIHQVPTTHLLGILIFHSLFLVFGFAAARGLEAVFAMLLLQAAVYVFYIARYTIRFGDIMHNGYLNDVFDLRVPWLVPALHQHMGIALGLAFLSALGLRSKRLRLAAFATLPFVLVFMFHIAARTGIVALGASLAFLAWAELWTRSRKLALASFAALLVSAVIASALFYRFALHDTEISAVESDAITRTIKEIQSDDPGFRLPIWERTWERIISDPGHLLLGKGIGSFAIDEGVGAPDWLLRKTEGAKHYPHNDHLEVLYEAGILALVAFTIVTAFPLVLSLKYWSQFSAEQRATIALYVFYLASVEISGSFAFTYEFQFFLALAIGVVALKRKELSGDAPKDISPDSSFKELTGPMMVH
jgi:O-antigen ligase